MQGECDFIRRVDSESMQKLVLENVKEAQQKQKRWYDRTAREVEFKPGDKALVLLPTSSNKFLAQWKGPFKILRKVGKVNYQLLMSKKRKKVFHVNMLKKWYDTVDEVMLLGTEMNDELECGEEDLVNWLERNDSTELKIGGELNAYQKEQLQGLLSKFERTLNGKIGYTSVMQHRIPTADSRPVRQAPTLQDSICLQVRSR